MADPLSVASTAVGFISVGIHVVEGIAALYAEWRNVRELVDRTATVLDGLDLTLREIEGIALEGGLPAERRTLVENAVESCRRVAVRLRTELDGVRKQVPDAAAMETAPEGQAHLPMPIPTQETTLGEVRAGVGKLEDEAETLVDVLRHPRLSVWASRLEEGLQQLVAVRQGIDAMAPPRGVDKTAYVLAWLSTLPARDHQRDILDRYESGTAESFLRSHEFADWKSEDTRLLWCYGGPGCGKTVLASAVVQHLESAAPWVDRGTAFAFLESYEPVRRTVEEVLGSLVRQLIEGSPTARLGGLRLDETPGQWKHRPTRTELLTHLRIVLSELSTAYIIVDGLDAFDQETRNQLIEDLYACKDAARVMFLSRSLPDVWPHTPDVATFRVHASKDEMRRYIAAQMAQVDALQDLCREHAGLADIILDGVRRKCSGLFPLAQLYVHSIGKPTRRQVEEAVEHLPHANDLSDDRTTLPGLMTSTLHLAANLGRNDVIDSLLRHGASPNVTVSQDLTALHVAVLAGHRATVSLLLSRGAHVDARYRFIRRLHASTDTDFANGTALHLAAAAGRLDVVRLLLDAGADVDAPDARGCTPLMAALATTCVARTIEPIVQRLLEAGADVHRVGMHRQTPLSLAAGRSQLGILRLLADAGADLETDPGLDAESGAHLRSALRMLLSNGGGSGGGAVGATTPTRRTMPELPRVLPSMLSRQDSKSSECSDVGDSDCSVDRRRGHDR